MKIKKLILHSDQLDAQEDFYSNTLGLPLLRKTKNEVSFKLQNSILKFVKSDAFHPYHFAFTISSNKIKESLKWLKKRVAILQDKGNEIVDFPAWNAESIYFYDPDKNILEFIVRKNLKNDSSGRFGPSDLLEISEIGLATADFNEKHRILTAIPGVEKFSGGKEVFSAIGSERGLIILIDKNKKDWIPTHDKAYASEFIAAIETDKNHYILNYQNEKLTYKIAI